jgi:hypothetical protein
MVLLRSSRTAFQEILVFFKQVSLQRSKEIYSEPNPEPEKSGQPHF